MNNIEFISYLDEAIKHEMLLGLNKNECKLNGLRNIKSDFNYIASRESDKSAVDIVRRLYKEREENSQLYLDKGRSDLWLQEKTEKDLLKNYLPKEPSQGEIIEYLEGLKIPKLKSNFKQLQDACIEKFGFKIDSSIILKFINS